MMRWLALLAVISMPLLGADGWTTVTPADVGLSATPLQSMETAIRSGAFQKIGSVLIARHGKLAYETYVQRIRESFTAIDHWSLEAAVVRRAVEANACASAAFLVAHSVIIRDAVQSGKVRLVVAYYDLNSGAVERIE